MSDASARGARFVEAQGDELARRRAAVLRGEAPLDRVLELLEPPATVGDALVVLRVLDDLRGLHAPVAERTVAWLERAQHEDGSWGDSFATGMLAGWLAKTPYARARTLDAAGSFLAAGWAPERVKGGAWEAIAAYAHYFANAPHDLSDAALQWCGRELERGFRTRLFDAVRTARVILWCDALAIPGARLRADELGDAILAEQQPDGGWHAAGDPSRAACVAHTLDALVALSRWRVGDG